MNQLEPEFDATKERPTPAINMKGIAAHLIEKAQKAAEEEKKRGKLGVTIEDVKMEVSNGVKELKETLLKLAGGIK